MAERKRFLLRVDPRLYSALEKWAADDLRSVNAQIEFVLSQALQRAGRGNGTHDEADSAASDGRRLSPAGPEETGD